MGKHLEYRQLSHGKDVPSVFLAILINVDNLKIM